MSGGHQAGRPHRVLMLIKTSALCYDDRLRKEVGSLREAGAVVEIVCLQDDNRADVGTIWDGTPFRALALSGRRRWPGHRHVGLHVAEFLLRLLAARLWRRHDVVWVHDPVLLPFVPLLAGMRRLGLLRRLVWDQHELPPEGWLAHPWRRALLRRLSRLPDALIVANPARADYLRAQGILQRQQATFVVQNYADERYASQPVYPLSGPLPDWLGGAAYLLLQGGGLAWRNFEAVLQAVMDDAWPALKVVVVGGYDEQLADRYRQREPQRFAERLYFVGMVPQLDLARYADHACASLILYRADTPNQTYCEPNRLYQALCRGTPVIVGNNPPMQALVAETGAGVVLADDGSDPEGILAAVRELLHGQRELARQAAATRGRFSWQTQVPVLRACAGL